MSLNHPLAVFAIVLSCFCVGLSGEVHREAFTTFNDETVLDDGPPKFYVHDSIVVSTSSFIDMQKHGEYFVVMFQQQKAPEKYLRAFQKYLRGMVDIYVFPCTGEDVHAGTQTEEICKHHYKGYPVIKLFRGKTEVVYDGAFNADELTLWVLKERSAALDKLEDAEQERLRSQYAHYRGGGAVISLESEDQMLTFITGATMGGKAAVIGFFAGATSNHYHHFKQVAEVLREEANYGVIMDNDLAEKLNVLEKPTILMYPAVTADTDEYDVSELDSAYYGHDSVKVPYEGKSYTDEPEIMRWVVENAKLPLTLLTQDAFMAYATTGKHMMVVCMDEHSDHEDQDELRSALLHAANKMDAYGIRMYYSYDKFRDDLEAPYVILLDVDKKVDYILPPETPVTARNLVFFADDFKKGVLTRTPRSQPIPETNDGVVKMLVAREWSKIVFDPAKDVVVYMHTPDCKPCGKFSKLFQRIATSLKHVPSLVFAAMDIEANELDAQYELKGVPAVLIFPAGTSEKYAMFEGGRTFNNIVAFIQNHAENPVGSPAAPNHAVKASRDEL